MKTISAASAAAVAIFMASAPVNAEADHYGSHRAAGPFSAGEPGDARKAARIVQVTMTEADGKMLFIPSRIEIEKDEEIRFILRDSGELDHEFVLATTAENLRHGESMKKNPDMEHDDPNAMMLAPKKTGDLLWKFSKAGEFEYSCLIPGHREAGMIGTIIVK